MRYVNRIGRLVAFLAFVFLPLVAQAQTLQSSQQSVALSMSVPQSITVTATPANISFNYSASNGGTATSSGPIQVVTTAAIAAGSHYLLVYAWFNSPAAALVGPQNIPSSSVFASTTGPSAFGATNQGAVACTGGSDQGIGVSGGQCGANSYANYADMPLDGAATGGGATGSLVLTDTVSLSMQNLGALSPGSYTGTLNFQAEII